MKDPVVIDVDSQDNSPVRNGPKRHTRAVAAKARGKRATPVGDVIELTDSENEAENARAGPSTRAPLARLAPQANALDPLTGPLLAADAIPAVGPSVTHEVRAPAAAPAPEEVRHAAALENPFAFDDDLYFDANPLFLPDDGDADEFFMRYFAEQPAPPPAPHNSPPAPSNSPPPQAKVAEPILDQDGDQQDKDKQPSFDVFIAQVLEIVPDVLPAHVFALLGKHYPNGKDRVVETVLHHLLENPDYPKANVKGKGKRKREDITDVEPGAAQERSVKQKIDYGDSKRERKGGQYYTELALEALDSEFTSIPAVHIRQVYSGLNMLYGPTYLALEAQQKQVPLPYKPMVRPRNKGRGKGKGVERHDNELEREMMWLAERRAEEGARRAAEAEEAARLEIEGGIECGCCFSEYPFDKMIQCPEAHLFCTSCMLTYAETKLGEHDANIVCIDQGGCKLTFPESELRRFLTPKLLELYERVRLRKEIEAAGIEGLEECPFCEYKVVIENEHERLFRCENEDCGAVTCRACKKLDHLPKSCKEVEDDKKLDARHLIEEAMTRALMRNCPKCQKAFIKEMGQPGQAQGSSSKRSKKCILWDPPGGLEGRHSDEVAAAAKRAIEEYKQAHPDIEDKDLHVDLPPRPPPPSPPRPPAPGPARAAAAAAPVHNPIPNLPFLPQALAGIAHVAAPLPDWVRDALMGGGQDAHRQLLQGMEREQQERHQQLEQQIEQQQQQREQQERHQQLEQQIEQHLLQREQQWQQREQQQRRREQQRQQREQQQRRREQQRQQREQQRQQREQQRQQLEQRQQQQRQQQQQLRLQRELQQQLRWQQEQQEREQQHQLRLQQQQEIFGQAAHPPRVQPEAQPPAPVQGYVHTQAAGPALPHPAAMAVVPNPIGLRRSARTRATK